MFVLGIDPGLTRTGYGVVGFDRRLRAVGVIRTDPDRPMAERLVELYGDLRSLIAEYHPDHVAIERVFTNRNRQTAIAVGRASGIALLAAGQAGIDVFEYSPTTVKAALTGDGRATKDMMGQMVARRLGIEAPPRPADATDAVAIALCHLQTSPVARSRA